MIFIKSGSFLLLFLHFSFPVSSLLLISPFTQTCVPHVLESLGIFPHFFLSIFLVRSSQATFLKFSDCLFAAQISFWALVPLILAAIVIPSDLNIRNSSHSKGAWKFQTQVPPDLCSSKDLFLIFQDWRLSSCWVLTGQKSRVSFLLSPS